MLPISLLLSRKGSYIIMTWQNYYSKLNENNQCKIKLCSTVGSNQDKADYTEGSWELSLLQVLP